MNRLPTPLNHSLGQITSHGRHQQRPYVSNRTGTPCECLKCGHKWLSNSAKPEGPKDCPRCGLASWRKP